MIEVQGNLWNLLADYRVITTNGFIKKDGSAVMGRGVALQAAKKYKDLPILVGHRLREYGNSVGIIEKYKLIIFPVKHNWFERGDLRLIESSTKQLIEIIRPELNYIMPRPGCNNGKLDWADVKPIVSILPDNVTIVHLSYEPT